jgi:hypothetical protein
MQKKFGKAKDLRCVLALESKSFAATSDATRLVMLQTLADSGFPFSVVLSEYCRAHADDPTVTPLHTGRA